MFSSTEALLNAIVQIENIKKEDLVRIVLEESWGMRYPSEAMYVHKDNKRVPLGYVTIHYRGVQPGRGKVYETYARFA